MTRFLAILTAGLISLHALLGCYGLRVCDLDDGEVCHVACVHEDCDHKGCDHEDSDGPADCCLVCRGTSTYLPPERPQVDDCFGFAATVVPPALTSLRDFRGGAEVADIQRTALGPPLRLHLLNQILLI